MKNLNSIRLFKLLLDILWYGFIILAGGLLFVNIFSIVFDGIVRNGNFMKVVVQQKGVSLPKFSEIFDFSISRINTIELKLDHFNIKAFSQPFILLNLTWLILTTFLGMFQLKLLRDFLKNILNKEIFTLENSNKLSKIAYLELITIPLSLIYTLLLTEIVNNGTVFNSNYQVVPNYAECLEPTFHVLEYFLFSGIFAFAYKLKQENDLTI